MMTEPVTDNRLVVIAKEVVHRPRGNPAAPGPKQSACIIGDDYHLMGSDEN